MSDPSNNIPTTTNNVLKNTNIYGGLAVLDNPTGSLGRLFVQRDTKIDGILIVNDRLIDASFIDVIDTIPSVDNKILVAAQNVSQQANTYTDTKIAQLIGTASESLDSIQELATAVQNNSSLVDGIYSVIGTKTTMGDVQTYVESNYYNKSTIDTKLTQTVATAQTNTNQTVAPLILELNNVKTGLNQKITATDMANYVTQNTYSKTYLDTKFVDTLSQANQYTNTAIQSITGYETTTSVNAKLENLQLQINQKSNINNPSFTGTVSGVSKSMVGLSACDNTSDANKPISTATQNALNLKANVNNPIFTGTVTGITKAMVGLGNVNNTSDFNKPISNATQNALGLKANILNPTFLNNITLNGTLTGYGDFQLFNDSTQTKSLAFNKTKETFGYYSDPSTNVWGFDGSGNMFTAGSINVQSGSNFNKTVTINEARGNPNLHLRSDNSFLMFTAADNSAGDSLILYRDVGKLSISCSSNNPNGLQLTSNLTKIYGDFEVSNGSVVGSPIFRPTGNCAFGLGNNVFNSSALLQPLIQNGITNGNGDGALFTQFNVSFNSWQGTGFVCTSNNTCNAVIDHSNGNFSTKGRINCADISASGALTLAGNLNCSFSDIFARSIALSNAMYATHIYAYEQIHVNDGTAVIRIANDQGINYIQSGTTLAADSSAKLRFTRVYNPDPTMTIDLTTRRIGINNDSPAEPLSVNGNAEIGGYLNLTGNLNMSNTDITARSATLSDNLSATNITASNSLTVGSINVGNELRKLTNQNYYTGNVTSLSQVLNNGLTNVQAFNVAVPALFKKRFTIYVPISLYRTIDTNSTGTISETINSITCSIHRNGVLWATPTYSFSTFFGAPFTQTFTIRSSGLFLSYESFLGTATVTFTPDVTNTSDTYTVSFTYNGTVSSNFSFSTRTRGITTNTTTSGIVVSSTANISTSVVNAITTGYRTPSYAVDYILPPSSDGTITEVSQNITSNSIMSQSINTNTLVAPVGIACFMFDGVNIFQVWPFCCSTRGILPQGADDYWVVNPGYSINIYSANNYTGSVYTLDNTFGTSPQRYASTPTNNARSIQVYYKYNEIAFSGISS